MEGADRYIISPAGALWFGNIAGGGGREVWQNWEFIFTIDSLFDRNIVFWSNLTFTYLRQE